MDSERVVTETSVDPTEGGSDRESPKRTDSLSPESDFLPPKCLRTFALAAIASRLPGPSASSQPPEEQFLKQHLRSVAPNESDWAEQLDRYLDEGADQDAVLVGLSHELALTRIELLTVALVVAVEEDAMVGRALAHVQAPVGGSRPTVGLLASSFDVARVSQRPVETIVSGTGLGSGLLMISDDGVPLPERMLSVPVHLFLALNGRDGNWPGATIGLGATPAVPLPPSILNECKRQAAGLLDSTERTLVLRTGSPAEGKSVADKIARELAMRPVFITQENVVSLTPWLLLRGLLPVFCFELGPGERKVLPVLSHYRGPVLALCGPDGSVEAAEGMAPSWTIPVAPRDERRQLWRVALDNEQLAENLARNHRHGSGRIAQLGRLARRQGYLDGKAVPEAAHVMAASWVGEGGGLDALAEPLAEPIVEEALVMSQTLRESLRALLLRCKARDGLVDRLGASAVARYHPGVRSLFVGPSGTGKTLAAGWIATQLGLPLYRVDLASVTSKYIGETEKNLSQLLARAEQAEVVLLFDEADSLFGKRTDVQQANDRFANAQTNYLLQRIETYDGITILTSNSRNRFDPAFSRRLDAVIEFPIPGPDERRRLWKSHIGTGHEISEEQLNRLAAVADLTGGQIRNVVLTAAVLAQEEEGSVQYSDIVVGLIDEYRKLGRQMPVELNAE